MTEIDKKKKLHLFWVTSAFIINRDSAMASLDMWMSDKPFGMNLTDSCRLLMNTHLDESEIPFIINLASAFDLPDVVKSMYDLYEEELSQITLDQYNKYNNPLIHAVRNKNVYLQKKFYNVFHHTIAKKKSSYFDVILFNAIKLEQLWTLEQLLQNNDNINIQQIINRYKIIVSKKTEFCLKKYAAKNLFCNSK